MVHIKSAHEIEKMAEAGRIVASVLLAVSRQVRPGISTADLPKNILITYFEF